MIDSSWYQCSLSDHMKLSWIIWRGQIGGLLAHYKCPHKLYLLATMQLLRIQRKALMGQMTSIINSQKNREGKKQGQTHNKTKNSSYTVLFSQFYTPLNNKKLFLLRHWETKIHNLFTFTVILLLFTICSIKVK